MMQLMTFCITLARTCQADRDGMHGVFLESKLAVADIAEIAEIAEIAKKNNAASCPRQADDAPR